jgi:hypothetical protein
MRVEVEEITPFENLHQVRGGEQTVVGVHYPQVGREEQERILEWGKQLLMWDRAI